MSASPRTAFAETAASLGEIVHRAEIDFPSLNRKISRCDLAVCQGTCCHDGVYLGADEAIIVPAIVEQHREALESFGLDLPEETVVDGDWRGLISGPKTATRPEPISTIAEDYPAHFPDTACVFLTADARCGLQILAESEGQEPWFFKPATCWIHPLSIVQRQNQPPLLTLFDGETDPYRFPDYDGFVSCTHCARTDETACGQPAFEVLAAELARLGELGGRDLLGEIRLNRVESPNEPC